MFRLCGLTSFKGLRICELGNQHIRKRARQWLAGRDPLAVDLDCSSC